MAAIFKKEDGAQSRHVYNWASTLAVNVMNNATAALSPYDRASLDKVTLAFVVSPAEPRVSFARVTCLRAFESGLLPPSRCIACHTLSLFCAVGCHVGTRGHYFLLDVEIDHIDR